DGGFSGESAIDRMRPKEQRFLTFGADLDAIMKRHIDNLHDHVERLTFRRDALEEHFRRTTDVTWSLENRSGTARTMVVTLDVVRNATFTGADAVDFDETSGHPVATFHVPARQESTKHTQSVEGLSRSTPLDAISAKALLDIVAAVPSLDARD